MTDKKRSQGDSARRQDRSKGTPEGKQKPSFEHWIGDSIDTNSETRGTGPRSPNVISDKNKGEKK